MPRHSLYVVQVMGGKEERVRDLVRGLLPDLVDDCYTPAYEAMRRVRGEWRLWHGLLFPGYLFVQTNDVGALADKLSGVPAFTRLLGANGDSFIPLTEDEIAWLNAFTDVDTHVARMSEGVIDGDRVLVTRGPLRGHEAEITRVDRHHRAAELEVTMCGRRKRVRVGLEIVRKKRS